MPWTIADTEKHNKGLTSHEKEIWVNVANHCLDSGDDDGTAIKKANGVIKRLKIVAHRIEAVLKDKTRTIIEEFKIEESQTILLEADPTPQIWQNEKGLPIVPAQSDWVRHYQNISLSHVKDQLQSARKRWTEVEKKVQDSAKNSDSKEYKFAQAELKNLRMNISAGEKALRQKNTATAKLLNHQNKIRSKHHATIHKLVRGVSHGILGGSPLMNHLSDAVAHVVANHVVGKIQKKK